MTFVVNIPMLKADKKPGGRARSLVVISGSVERHYLRQSHPAEFARFKGPEPDAADSHSLDGRDLVANSLEHSLDLSVDSLGDFDLESACATAPRKNTNAQRLNQLAVEFHPPAKRLLCLWSEGPCNSDLIPFPYTLPGMEHPLGEVSIVGEDYQPLGVVIEASDGIDPLGDTGEKIEDRPCSPIIAVRAQAVFRFMEDEI